jgi:hypothetical protein
MEKWLYYYKGKCMINAQMEQNIKKINATLQLELVLKNSQQFYPNRK